jgi:hypothetical protein
MALTGAIADDHNRAGRSVRWWEGSEGGTSEGYWKQATRRINDKVKVTLCEGITKQNGVSRGQSVPDGMSKKASDKSTGVHTAAMGGLYSDLKSSIEQAK